MRATGSSLRDLFRFFLIWAFAGAFAGTAAGDTVVTATVDPLAIPGFCGQAREFCAPSESAAHSGIIRVRRTYAYKSEPSSILNSDETVLEAAEIPSILVMAKPNSAKDPRLMQEKTGLTERAREPELEDSPINENDEAPFNSDFAAGFQSPGFYSPITGTGFSFLD
jgi:hypothetical protein